MDTEINSMDYINDPIDYDKYICENIDNLSKDPLKNYLLLPDDDIQIVDILKRYDTVDLQKPELEAEIDLHVNECIRSYNSNYLYIIRNYEKYNASNLQLSKKRELKRFISVSERQEYEIDLKSDNDGVKKGEQQTPSSFLFNDDVNDLEKLEADDLIKNLFDDNSNSNGTPAASSSSTTAASNRATCFGNNKTRCKSLFNNYKLLTDDNELIEYRHKYEPPSDYQSQLNTSHILVKCTQLRFDLEIEPIFASMSLYDLKERKRISENFYFDLNSDNLKAMIQLSSSSSPLAKSLQQNIIDLSTLSHTCLFNITYPSSDIYLVIRIEKVLQQGDISDCAEPYLKYQQIQNQQEKQNYRDKTHLNAQQFCDRLGKHRMPFAWTAINIMNIININNSNKNSNISSSNGNANDDITINNGGSTKTSSLDRNKNEQMSFKRQASLKEDSNSNHLFDNLSINQTECDETKHLSTLMKSFKPISICINTFFKEDTDKLTDDDLYRLLNELKKSTNHQLKKLKCIPGTLKMEFSPYTKNTTQMPLNINNYFFLNSSLQRLKYFKTDAANTNCLYIIKDVHEYPSKPVLVPNYVYLNLLYVHPLSISFTPQRVSTSSARNIAIKLQFMKGEEEHCALPIIFGRSSQREYLKEVYSYVLYHNKTPQFHDEFKIKLPALLSGSNYHLLFTFYHVSCNYQQTQLETCIGYSWLPLIQQDNRCIYSGTYTLPIIYDKLQPGYSNQSPFLYTDSNNTNQTSNNSNMNQQSTNSSINKSLFEIKINLQSTIHTQDIYIDKFISITNHILTNDQQNQQIQTTQDLNIDQSLKQALSELIQADNEALIKYLFIIFDKLFNLMMIFAQTQISLACMDAICKIVNKVTSLLNDQINDLHNRNKYLVQYINYASNLPYKTSIIRSNSASMHIDSSINCFNHQRLFHEELIQQLLTSNEYLRELEYTNAWFYLELLFKSMCFYVLIINNNHQPNAINNANNSSSKYQQRFSKRFLDDIQLLIKLIERDILNKYFHLNYKLSHQLNCSLAFFLYDCFSILDRNYVYQLISIYIREINTRIKQIKFNPALNQQQQTSNLDVKYLYTLKLDFLRILCSHEHFITLNLPFLFNEQTLHSQQSPSLHSPSSSLCSINSQTSLNSDQIATNSFFFTQQSDQPDTNYLRKHYLLGLLLQNVYSLLQLNVNTPAQSNIYSCILTKLINLLRGLFESHDYDDRFNKDKQIRSRIASLYTPFFVIIIKYLIPDLYELKCQQANSNNKKDTANLKCRQTSFLLLDQQKPVPTHNSSPQGVPTQNTNRKLNRINDDTIKNLLICCLWMIKNLDTQQLFDLIKQFNVNNLNKLLQLMDLCVANFEYKGKKQLFDKNINQIKKQKLIKTKLEDLIIGTQNARTEFIRRSKALASVDSQTFDRLSTNSNGSANGAAVDDVYDHDLDYFDHDFIDNDDQLDENLEFKLTTTASTSNENGSTNGNGNVNGSNSTTSNNQSSSLSIHKTLRWRKDQTKIFSKSLSVTSQSNSTTTNQIINPLISTITSADLEDFAILQANLATECICIVLDTIELIVKLLQTTSQATQRTTNNTNQHNSISTSSNSTSTSSLQHQLSSFQSYSLISSNIFKIILNALSLNQSVFALNNLFTLQRSIVSKFPELLFEFDSEFCADMCSCLLKHCTSSLSPIRSQSSASLYLLMRQNFDIGNNFSRVKMQITIALSHLVGQSSAEILFNELYLKKSLRTILAYADTDFELVESTFPSQVKDLVLNLNMILCDTVKMKDYINDNEMLVDLMHRIANCYQNNPDMRLTWLQNMAQKHLKCNNLIEAGQCLVHAASLVAEYLGMFENKPYLPIGCNDFRYVSINVLEESAISDDILTPNEDSFLCTGKYFSESGLIGLIEQAAVFLIHSQHYEVANNLYKVLIPIYEAYRDYKKLSQVHSKLNDCFNKIMLQGSKRLFGTYFRVGFYGKLFEELDNEEFIYKEPGITKLSEIAHRLEAFYDEKFGCGCLEIMKDSNIVDRKSLDPNKAYIQITYVEPYFDRYDQQICVTHFEKNYGIKRFIYSTPFTLDGKAHGSLKEQYKRKVILTTERAFPYVKTRVSVIDRQQIVLTPVEVAIEDLQKKIDELKDAIHQEPPDPKILQMVLQGCVGTTVNQGPLEMALAFLQPNSTEPFTEHHNKLRLCFKEFTRRCMEALKKNKTLIGPDQREYQKEMERNNAELRAKIEPMIENRAFK